MIPPDAIIETRKQLLERHAVQIGFPNLLDGRSSHSVDDRQGCGRCVFHVKELGVALWSSSTYLWVSMVELQTLFRDIPCDVFSPNCPARTVLILLAEKWSLLTLHALSEGTHRTGELRRRIGGISEKMLIQTLKRLEAAGLVVRTSYAEVPPRVDYALTKLGWSLSPIVKGLDEWVEQHAKAMTSPALP